jgi:hypothetical protein
MLAIEMTTMQLNIDKKIYKTNTKKNQYFKNVERN